MPVGGVKFLAAKLGSSARLIVEAAFGADLAADPTTWTWHDITTDVRQADGQTVQISPMGRADEASKAQPAGCTFQLKNTSGAYSKTTSSIWYPNIRRNTPIRVSVNLTGNTIDTDVRFQGYANGFTPGWDASGRFAIVSVSASGVSRRLAQGLAPTLSMLYRTTVASASLVSYWPLEDGSGSTQAVEVVGNNNMAIVGDDTSFGFGQASAATLGGSRDLALPPVSRTGVATVGAYPSGWTTASGWSVTWVQKIPQQPGTAQVILVDLYSADANARNWRVLLGTDGKVRVEVYDSTGTEQLVDAGTVFDALADGSVYGRWLVWSLSWAGPTTATISCKWASVASSVTTTNTLGVLPGVLTSVHIPGGPTTSDLFGVGHLTVWSASGTGPGPNIAFGYAGENAVTRLQRLCAEQDVPITVSGTSTTTMGAQGQSKFLDLLRECETADDGVLVDGRGPGFTYFSRDVRANAAVALTADVPSGQVQPPFVAVDDDQRNVNYMKVDRTGGSSATYQDATGPLGTAAIGTYDSSLTVNVADDTGLAPRASWEVHKGTVNSPYRYPTFGLNFARSPTLATSWLAADVSSRLTVTNITSKITQHPAGDIDLLLEGWAETLSAFAWRVVANCSPFEPWRIFVVSTDRCDTSSSQLASGAALGATSLSVAFTGSKWGTADLPFDISVGGVKTTVSAISGSTSPQTFTVSALSQAVSSGAAVSVWNPRYVGL